MDSRLSSSRRSDTKLESRGEVGSGSLPDREGSTGSTRAPRLHPHTLALFFRDWHTSYHVQDHCCIAENPAFVSTTMDRRIFEQLDMLERGARDLTRPRRDEYNNSSAEYSAYDEQGGGHRDGYEAEDYYAENEFADQPMTLDSFGAWM